MSRPQLSPIYLCLVACAGGVGEPDAGLPPVSQDAGPTDSGPVGDRTPPALTSMAPADGAVMVALNAKVVATFSEALDCASVRPSTLTLSAGTVVQGNLSCAGSSIELVPAAALQPATAYTINLVAEVKDLAGNTITSAVTSRFTTGTQSDTTPPANPAVTGPSPIPATTMVTPFSVQGTKDLDSNLEAKWSVDGVLQHDFQQVVGFDGSGTWSYDFPLLDGSNTYELRGQDGANNPSCTTGCPSFTLTKLPQQNNNVPVPTVTFAANTNADRQVLAGTKSAGTGIELNGNLVVPVSAATTWDWQVSLNPGLNNLQLRARNGAGQTSSVVPVDINYTRLADIPGTAELKVQLELADLWNEVGDEFRITNVQREIGHYAVNIWLEGPLTATDDRGTPNDPSDDLYERCYYDAANFQRKYTRYATTLNFTAAFNTMTNSWVAGHWWEPNHFIPNYYAALVEGGIWANATRPIPPGTDRRDANGGTYFVGPGVACPPGWFAQANGNCKPNTQDSAPIDVVTEASINPAFDTQGVAALGNQAAVGAWKSGLLTYPRRAGDDPGGTRPRWKSGRAFNWNDARGNPLPQGAYLLNVMLVLDRSAPAQQGPGAANATAPFQWLDVLRTDRETCWDNPAHDLEGSHRAEAVVFLGPAGFVTHLDEKGPVDEVVDACHNARPGVRCSGADLCDWNGDSNFGNDPSCAAPVSNVGANVRYTVSQPGWPAPVRVEYCPAGCP